MAKISFESDQSNEEEEEGNLKRWEEMYYGGGAGDQSFVRAKEESIIRSEIRVVTFDLDNTIWKTSKCINAANDALSVYLNTKQIVQPKRVEVIMGDLFQKDKKRYAPLDENPKAPVLLTQLRIDAVKNLLESFNGYSEDDATQLAEEAFQVWTNARHGAIPENFAQNVLPCLEKISSIRTSAGQPVVIGAITDGNSDPRNVEQLKGYFDFCVNAEMVGVAKPDKRVYMEAARHVLSNVQTEDDLENSIGPYWVHIGDDFSKDIVPAKELTMRTIWATELIQEKLQKGKLNLKDESNKREVGDFMKEMAKKEVIEMPIGATNYLADSLTEEFADKVADEFNNLSVILLEWHREGSQKSPIFPNELEDKQLEKPDNDEAQIPEDPSNGALSDDVDFLSSTTFASRTFRLMREDLSMDVPAPLKKRETLTMKDVMTMAQLDKSSGVFSFPVEDMEALQKGQRVLMIEVGNTGLKFSREIFVGMSIEEVLTLTEENPVRLSLYMQDVVDSPSFDLF